MARILIVDDDPDTRQGLRQILEGGNHSVLEASNGHEALEMLERHHPSLLVVDIIMPEMDGLETIMSARRQGYRLPIIAMPVGEDTTEERYSDFARSFGANDVLLKPFARAEVLDVVRKTLDRAE